MNLFVVLGMLFIYLPGWFQYQDILQLNLMISQSDKRNKHFEGQTLRRLKQTEENILSLKDEIKYLKKKVNERLPFGQKGSIENMPSRKLDQEDLIKIQETKQQLAKLKSLTQNLKIDFSQNKQNVIQAFQKLKEQLKIQLSKFKLDKEKELIQSKNLQHPQSPHKSYFKTFKMGTDTKVVRTDLDNTSYRNFIDLLQIGEGDVVNFKVKIHKLTNNGILLGVGTSTVFDQLDPFKDEACFYSANVGGIWNGAALIDIKNKSGTGDSLQLSVDRKKNQILWKRNGETFELTKMPNTFQKKTASLIIKLANSEDYISISTQRL